MNIGFFSETYSPDINGVITSMKVFKDELERAGHRVFTFVPDTAFFAKNGQPQEPDTYLFRSFKYPMYESLRVAVPYKRGFMKEVQDLKLDVVHSHTPFSMGHLADRVARAQGIPHIHTYHTLYPEYAKHYFPGPSGMISALTRKVTARFCNGTDRVLAPSDGVYGTLQSYGITRPMRVLSTGIDRTVFETRDPERAVRKRYGIPADAPLVVTVARMGYEKSIDFLLRSFKELLALTPDAYYLLVGDGPAKASLEVQARELGVTDRVVFTGFIHDRAEVARAYANADVFAFASKTETQCLTLLEAAAVGLPLVARYDKPLVTALSIGENGFFEETEAAFAARMCQILEDPKLAQGLRRGSQRVASRQSAEERARELLGIYLDAIAESEARKGTDGPEIEPIMPTDPVAHPLWLRA